MKTFRIIITAFIMMCGITNNLWAAPGVMEILAKMDEIEELGADITVKAILTEQKANQGVRMLEGVYYRRDSDDAYLIIMTAPETSKGNGYLRVGDNMWMYRRNTRTFQIMVRGQSIEGSGADAGDLEKRKLVELYEPALDEQGSEILAEETLTLDFLYAIGAIRFDEDLLWRSNLEHGSHNTVHALHQTDSAKSAVDTQLSLMFEKNGKKEEGES